MQDWMPAIRVLLAGITAFSVPVFVLNAILTGRDIPSGILTLVMFILGAIYGVDAVQHRWGRKGGGKDDDRS